MRIYTLMGLAFVLCIFQSFAYTTHIDALAVVSGTGEGVATPVYLNVTPGTGALSLHSGNSTVGSSTVQSMKYAIAYAASYLGLNRSAYNYNFTIVVNNSNISGPSAGLPFTLLAIAALEHRQLPSGIAATGTISPNGTVGEIGGVYDKARAASKDGSRLFLVPYAYNDSFEDAQYYMAQQAYGITVVEVANAVQAIPYVFGNKTPEPLSYNISANYNASMLNSTSAICPGCAANDSGFVPLVNDTFGVFSATTASINGTLFGGAKQQLYNQLSQYREIAAKGYLYSASNLAFLDYPEAFMLAHYNDSSVASAKPVINSIYNYCDSLNPPQLTYSNYEYVTSGEARYAWAMTALSQADEILNASQSSDDVFAALITASRAYAWCSAVAQLYNISAAIGGSPAAESPQLESVAASQISAARGRYGNQLYVNESEYSYGAGQYAAALYSLAYARTFYNTSTESISNASSAYGLMKSAVNSANGAWPREFGLQAYFYLGEAGISSNSSIAAADISAAKSTAQLSLALDSVNSEIKDSLLPLNSTIQSGGSEQLYQLQSEVNTLYAVVIVLAMLVAIILAVLLVHMVGGHKQARQQGRRAR